jgi:hypothetical protein
VTPEQYRKELPVEGAPEEAAEELNALYAGMRAGLYTEPRDGVRRALGRDPIDFGDYVARTVSALALRGRSTRTSLAGSSRRGAARQIKPRASMASATRRKPSMFAPAT